ncbi:MAG TPA: long-chain-fatty-acid--CoA ligase [Acidimicrobiales bacterium]|nr:long-chain-fatty-acid--CoA ligase [Acidimicrobiales bacterium]
MKELVYSRFLLPAVERLPDKVAVADEGFEATFDQHLDRVLRLADAMTSELGLRPGDRVAVTALNGHRYLELYHAAFLSGLCINPLNLRLAPRELSFILSDSGTEVCFADALFGPGVAGIRAEVGLRSLVLMGDGDIGHDASHDDLVAAGEPRLPEEPDEDDPAVLMYTGGTTGLPKGVVVDHRAAMLDLYKVAAAFTMDEGYVYLHQTPMFHAASFGGVLATPAAGGRSTFVPAFDPKAVLDVIERQQVTMTVMVPTMVGMLLAHPDFRPERLSSMRHLVYGASPMPSALLERLMTALPEVDIWQGYGMTENCGLLTLLRPEDHRRGGDILRSAGRPVLGAVVRIEDEEGRVVAPGETGEICARAGNFMHGYWNRPEETAEAFRGGWYHTGDAGYVDADGYVYLVDRVKDMIVTGGENVYSVEVENAVASHPAVAQVAVIGIPSEQWGEAVHAIVVLKPDASATEEEIRDHARGLIAGYKVPKTVEFRTEQLPLSGAMKVLKRELRAPYWEGQGRSVN